MHDNTGRLELKKLSIENFKAFKTCTLELAPLTILIGENSSGKSSLLQALLLLKQTLESPPGGGILNLNSHYVQFHQFREIVFSMPFKEASVGFELEFQQDQLSFKVGTGQKGNQLNLFDVRVNNKSLSLDKIGLSVETLNRNATLRSLLNYYLQVSKREGIGQLNEMDIMLLFAGIGYVQPIRPLPQRYYDLRGTNPYWIGSQAEDIADFLEANPAIKKQVRHWFVELAKLAQEVKFKSDPKRGQMEIIFTDSKSGLEIDISRLGFGISQILPIVIATFSQMNMLIFEAPEIHLNPKLHGVLTDMFVEGALSGKQVLVETHSEHVVYRVQRRIAEGKIAPEAVAIYYVQWDKTGANAKRLTMTETGEIPEYCDKKS
jgi:predicted ATPase